MKPVALVTASSQGMGEAIARELRARGYELALMARTERVVAVADELGGLAMQGSVTEPADLERFVKLAMERYGRIDAVVNHTGHPPKGDLLAIPDADWHLGLDVVLLNVVRMARLVTPIMEKAGKGAIVNISTFAAFEPDPDFPVSASLRTALAAFTKLYADRYARAGHPHEQRPAGLHRQPAREGGPQGPHSDGSLWDRRRNWQKPWLFCSPRMPDT